MTLYWYMHWFWITCHLYVNSEVVTTKFHSISPEISKNISTSNETTTFGRKTINRPFHIPPIVTSPANMIEAATTITEENTVVTQKSVIKNKLLSRLNEKKKSSTATPPVKEASVIELNATEFSINVNNLTSFNTINQIENLSYVGDDVHNQSLINNFERITTDNDGTAGISAAGITGITLGCVSIVSIIITVSFVLYRNRGINRPQVLNDHCSNLDSSGYIDDASIRDNSEEMYSLDNDSFLNSLEAMTIQNYWTDTVKHTKL